MYKYKLINSHLFPTAETSVLHMLPSLHTPLTSRLVHIHQSDYTRTPVARTTHLTFLKNLSNEVNVCPSRASPPSVATHVYFISIVRRLLLILSTWPKHLSILLSFQFLWLPLLLLRKVFVLLHISIYSQGMRHHHINSTFMFCLPHLVENVFFLYIPVNVFRESCLANKNNRCYIAADFKDQCDGTIFVYLFYYQ